MRAVIWTDRRGWRRRSLIRDDDPDEMASLGIPSEPPDLDRLDWDAIKKDIHNRLMDMGLYTWLDVQKAQNAVTGIVKGTMTRRIIALYRESEAEQKS